ncbi:MAG: putative rane protein [Herbinix sp.]|jgi:stage II sporulation protein M|nr:putative rane protein [Herbinix sp.]
MKLFKFQLQKFNILQIAIFLIVIGVFLGILCANIFKGSYMDQIQSYEANVFSRIVTNDTDYSGLFRYTLGRNFSEFAIFWLLCMTILGLPYMAFKIISFGFFSGFFISAITMQYGMKGILLVLAYVFPHGLLYVPIVLISLYKGFDVCRTIYQDNNNQISKIVRLMKSQLIIILLLAVALLIASFLEAYPGAFLLKKALGIYVS